MQKNKQFFIFIFHVTMHILSRYGTNVNKLLKILAFKLQIHKNMVVNNKNNFVNGLVVTDL